MSEQRFSVPSKKRIRTLKQYKDMSDEEFDEIWEKKVAGVGSNKEFETRIERKILEFSKDYDLSDLKANDHLNLRALAQAYIQLEDLENYSYTNRLKGISDEDILFMEKLGNIMSGLRRDISKMQDDLKITRRIRKGDKEESVINYIEDLKRKAKEFYESRMLYLFCDKCSMLLGTVWVHYTDEKDNRVQLVCNRKLQDGTICGNKLQIQLKNLYDDRIGANIDNVPEFFSR